MESAVIQIIILYFLLLAFNIYVVINNSLFSKRTTLDIVINYFVLVTAGITYYFTDDSLKP